MELELQNVPHHPEIATELEEEEEHSEAEEGAEGDVSGEGQVAVENAWMEYNHNRLFSVRVGKQLSPQVLVAESLSEPDALDRTPDLPPRVVPGRNWSA